MRTRLALVCLLLVASPAGAQETAPVPEAPPAEPVTVPLAEISSRAEAMDARLREIAADLEAPNAITQIQERLAAVSAEVETRGKRLDQALAQAHQASDLQALSAGWTALVGRLERVEAGLAASVADVEQQLAEVRASQQLWLETRRVAREASAPEGVLRQIAGVSRSLARTEQALAASRNAALELQAGVREQLRAGHRALERLVAVRAELRGRLFVRDSDPLWTVSFAAESVRELAEIGPILQRSAEPILHYAELNSDRLIVHGLLLLVLLWAALRGSVLLKRDIASREPAQEAPRSVLNRPWAAGLLLGLSPTNFLHPALPTELRMVFLLVALTPWRRLLAEELPPALRAPLNGLTVLLVLEAARNLLDPEVLLSRGLLLTQLGLGAAGLVWLRRPQRITLLPEVVRSARWLRALDLWLRLSLVSMLAGLVALATGFGSLAILLLMTPLYGSFTATVLALVVRILDELIGIALAAGAMDRSRLVRERRAAFHGFLTRGLGLLAVFFWAYWTLQRISLWDPVYGAAQTVLSARLGYGAVSISVGGVLAFALTIWLSWLLSRFISLVMDREVFARTRMPPGVPFALTTLTRYAVLVAGFMIAVGMLGFSLDRLTLVLSALGVGIGFGLQNVINNFVSGLILLFERPVRVGDRVQLDDLLGDVTSIGIRASKVRTIDGSDVIVPNGDFISARVVNWTLADKNRRIILPVGVAYGTRPGKVLEVLEAVARAHPEVLDRPEPEILFRGFGDSSLDFEIRAWADGQLWMRVASDLAVATYDALAEAGMEIPFPQRDLHLKSIVPEAQKALADALRPSSEPGV